MMVGAAFIPVNIGPGLNLTFIFCGFLILVWLLDAVLNRRRLASLINRTSLPLVLLICVATISFVIGQFQWFPIEGAPIDAQLAGLAIFWFSAGAYFMAARQLRDLRLLKRVVGLFLLLGGLYVIVEAVPSLELISSPFIEAGSMGSVFWTWLVALAFAQAAFNRALTRRTRTILLLLVAATMYVALIQNTDWASGWLPPLIALGVIVAVRMPRVGLCLGLLTLAMVPLIYQRLFDQIMVSESYSYMTRMEAWRVALTDIVRVNPLLGLGPANYYFYGEVTPILGWYVKFSSHNNYVDMLTQTGILGFVCLLWFFLAIGWLGLRLLGRVPSGFPLAYVYGAVGGMGGTVASGMLADWFFPFVYNIGVNGFRSSVLFWMFLGGLHALELTTRESSSR